MKEVPGCCFVLGMHRSGTSMLAGLLEGMGLSAGRDVMGAGAFNPLGHYENMEIVRFHDHVLSALGSRWHDPRPLAARLRAEAHKRFAAWRARLAEILAEQFATGCRAVIKDPRLCRLLPLWEPVISGTGRPVLLIIRHPAAVAGSLLARDKFSPAKALALWLAYNLEMERETRRYEREFVFYPEFLSDPIPACRHLQQRLGLGECDVASLLPSRLRSDLCHQGECWPEAPAELITMCGEAFRLFRQHATDSQKLDALYRAYSGGFRGGGGGGRGVWT